MQRQRQIQGSLPAPVARHVSAARVEWGQPEVEYRFTADAMQAQAFLSCIAGFLPADAHDSSYLLTTYFDTADQHFFQACGRLRRARVRVRQYAAAAGGDGRAIVGPVCAFDVKMSIFESRRIARLSDTPGGIRHVLHGGGWRDDPDLGALRPLRRAARGVSSGKLRPVLTTYFHRVSRSAPGMRVTVDDQIAFAQPAAIIAPGTLAEPDAIYSRSPHHIIEVKLSAPPPTWLADAMRMLRRPNPDSKFHDGVRTAQRLAALAAAARIPSPGRSTLRGRYPFEQETTYA